MNHAVRCSLPERCWSGNNCRRGQNEGYWASLTKGELHCSSALLHKREIVVLYATQMSLSIRQVSTVYQPKHKAYTHARTWQILRACNSSPPEAITMPVWYPLVSPTT